MTITVQDILKLSGTQKAAIALLSLSSENATKILAMMSEDEVKEVSHAMSKLGTITPSVVHYIMSQLHDDVKGNALFMGNLHTTERLLSKVLDKEKVQAIMEDLRGPQGKNTWEKLTNVNETILALYLQNEHPQTAALILSKISSEHAAKVLHHLPENISFDILKRIINIGNVKEDVLDKIEEVLRTQFISSFGRRHETNSYAMVADIFNNLDRVDENKYMQMLEHDMPKTVIKIKDLMFTFDDLIKIDPKGIQKLLHEVDKSKLVVALKGANDQIKDVLLSGMSQRAAKIINEELEFIGPVRVKEVDAARLIIVNLAKKLIKDGEIDVILDNKDEFIT